MRKRYAVSLIALIVVLLLLVPATLVLVVPAVSTEIAERAIRSATGVDARVASIEVDLFPPVVRGHGLELPSAGAGMEDPAMTVQGFALFVDPARWWDDAPTWWSGTASGVLVRMARDGDGGSNWPTGQPQTREDPKPTEEQSAAFRFSSVNVNDLDFYRVTPEGSQHINLQQLEVTRDSDERVQFSLDGTWRDQPVSANGSVPLPSSERAREISVDARLSGTTLNVEGTVGHDGVVPGQADFKVEADELALISMIFDTDLTALAPLSLQGQLVAPSQGRWELRASGEVGNQPLDLAVNLASAGLDAEDAVMELEQASLSFGPNSVEATGRVNTSAQTATLDVQSEFLDLNQVLSLLGPGQEAELEVDEEALAFTGPWQMDLTVSLRELVYQQFRANQLNGELRSSQGELDANLQLSRFAGISSKGDSEASDEASTGQSAASEWAVSDLQVTATLHPPSSDASDDKDKPGATHRRQLTASLSAPGMDADVDASLAADDLRLISGTFDAEVEDFSAVTGFQIDAENPPWRNLMPFALNIHARPHDGGWELDPLELNGGGNDLQGTLTVDPTRQPLYIGGRLEAGVIDLNRIRTTSRMPGSENGAEGDEQTSPAESSVAGDIFSTEPIDWGWLDAATLDIEVGISELHFNQTVFRDVTVPLNLSEGLLRIDPLSANLSEGGVRGHVVAERSQADALLDTELVVTNLQPADLGMKDTGLIDGGNTDLLFNLDSRGESPQALASNLRGEIALEVQNATIRNDLFEVIGSDLLTQTAELINPFSQRDDTTELECAAAYFVAGEGVLKSVDTLVIETSKMKIRGSGELNLKEEKLRIDFTPSARSGIGVSLGDLSSMVRIGGTLSNPSVEPDPSGVAKAGATIGAAVATGGLSLLAKGLFDRARNAGGTACGKIFEQAPATDVPVDITPSM